MLAWVSITPLGRPVVPLGVRQDGDVLGGVDGDVGHRPRRGEQVLDAAVALRPGRRSTPAGRRPPRCATGSSAPTVTTSDRRESSSWLAMSFGRGQRATAS